MAQPPSEPGFVRLLDIEPELAERLREDDRAEARQQLRLRLTVVPEGSWTLATDARHGRPFGLMVVDGVLLQEVHIANRAALQILGPGDVVLPDRSISEALDVDLRWTAAVESRVAVLDDRLQRPFAMWPGIAVALVERAGRQLSRVAIQTAIAQLPRVEQRLEATFWELAERWGRVTPSGIHVPLKLTHEVLARLVGGRRPTITLALRELADRGILTRRPDRTWLLVARTPTLGPSADRPAAPPLVALSSTHDDMGAAREPWDEQEARRLLETARRMRGEHAARMRDLAGRLERFQDARTRSEELRAHVLQAREQRQAGRARRAPRST
ncbi:MAG TPA: Crp/Fnr family transcriptional regulator [Baekduia sp.]|nr:Crp/Fnr family transcriptional regulator [Baekduia sp.]